MLFNTIQFTINKIKKKKKKKRTKVVKCGENINYNKMDRTDLIKYVK